MLRISLPENQRPERSWICGVLLGEFLGLDVELAFDHGDTVRISAAGRMLRLPDVFFAGAARPDATPQQWIVARSGLDARLCEAGVPVLFGAPGFTIDAGGNAALSLDVFGSAFFMLGRHEESVSRARDGHGRLLQRGALPCDGGALPARLPLAAVRYPHGGDLSFGDVPAGAGGADLGAGDEG